MSEGDTTGPVGGSQPTYGPPPGTDPYGQPPPYAPPAQGPPRSNNAAIAALIVGIVAVLTTITLVGGVVLGFVAIVLGAIGVSKAGQVHTGKGQAIAGIVLGTIAVLLVVAIVALGFIVASEMTGGGFVEDLELPVEVDGSSGG